MEISQEALRALLEAFDKSDWQEMTLSVGTDRLHVSRRASANGAAPWPPPAAASPGASPRAEHARVAAPAEPAPLAAAQPETQPKPAASVDLPDGTVVASPSVGLFWRSPSPGAPPFVDIGQSVAQGDTLAIVEVMKLMNHVVAPHTGVVVAIVPENGQPVEHGQPLVVVEPGS
jgi:acetyl-CoA carboxylase biotin carboxyl carrier protein